MKRKCRWQMPANQLQACPLQGATCRGRWHPAGAHGSAVGALRRLRCDARVAVARRTRFVRFAHFAQTTARVSQRCALRAPTLTLRFSPLYKSPPPGTTRRESAVECLLDRGTPSRAYQNEWVGGGAPVQRRVAQGAGPRAQRASLTDSTRLFECSERSERSELSVGPRHRATQGSRRAASTAEPKRRRPPNRSGAEPTVQVSRAARPSDD
jgi:hypothetical protein